VLHLNGELMGVDVGASPNPLRDIKTICHVLVEMHREIAQQKAHIDRINQKIASLKHELKCFMNTNVQTAVI